MNTIKLGDGSVLVFTKVISVFTDCEPDLACTYCVNDVVVLQHVAYVVG